MPRQNSPTSTVLPCTWPIHVRSCTENLFALIDRSPTVREVRKRYLKSEHVLLSSFWPCSQLCTAYTF